MGISEQETLQARFNAIPGSTLTLCRLQYGHTGVKEAGDYIALTTMVKRDVFAKVLDCPETKVTFSLAMGSSTAYYTIATQGDCVLWDGPVKSISDLIAAFAKQEGEGPSSSLVKIAGKNDEVIVFFSDDHASYLESAKAQFEVVARAKMHEIEHLIKKHKIVGPMSKMSH